MFSRRFARAVLGHRVAVLAIVSLITVIAAIFASRVSLESSIEIWFLENDPDLVSYRDFLERFEADELVVMGVFAEDVFDSDVLGAIDRLTREARDAPYVHRVLSATNVDVFEATDGGVAIAPLVPDIPRDPAALEDLRRRALENDLVRGHLVAPDGEAAAIIVEMLPEGNTVEGKSALVGSLSELAERVESESVRIRLSGSPVFDDAFFRYSEADMRLFGPIVFLLVLAASFLLYRRASAALVPLSIVVIATIWTYGVMGAARIDVNIVTAMLPALVLAIGVADSVHVLSEYTRQLALGQERRDALEASIVHLLVPCFFTSATTAIGLSSLVASDLAPIREFGWLSALGVVFAFLLSITFVPAILGLARPPDPDFVERRSRGPLARCLERLGRPTARSSRRVLAGFSVLFAVALGGASLLEVGSNPINYLRRGDPVRQDMEVVDRELGGSSSVEFLVEAPSRGLQDPETLQRLDRLQTWLGERDGILQTVSILDALKEMNRVFRDGDPEQELLPDSRALAAQYYLLMEGEEDFEAFVQHAYSVGRISGRISLTDADEAIAEMEPIEEKLAREYSGSDLRVEATGFLKLMADMEVYLLDSQIRTFLIAFVAVTAMMILLLRSVRLGLFSMIPNLGPILFGLGFMGLVGIPLDPGTVMIASIALGLVVDDSVHFLFRLRLHSRRGTELAESIRRTMNETGRPIVVTSIVLAASFAVLGLGSFTPNVYFGIVSAVVVILALVADLVVLPAALLLARPRI